MDYIGPQNFALDLCSKVSRVVLIDHHKTAIDIISTLKSNYFPPNFEVNLKMEKSGATLAYDYFNLGETFENQALKKKMEEVYALIEAQDLYKHIPNSKEYNSGFNAHKIDLDFSSNPDLFQELLDLDTVEVIKLGKDNMEKEKVIIDDELSRSYKIDIGGTEKSKDFGQCLAVVTQYPQYRSELGNLLAQKSQAHNLKPIGIISFADKELPENQLKISLRSLGNEDTTIISKYYNGGGHANASSFIIEKSIYEKWKCI